MTTLVLVRHGQSLWNAKNLFTGWVDVDLTTQGETEAQRAGQLLNNAKLAPEIVHTSVLHRAIETAQIILKTTGSNGVMDYQDWHLNERHYGALQGTNKTEAVEKYGEEQVNIWRRGYDVAPPPLDDVAFKEFIQDARYFDIADQLPRSESLADVVARVVPYFQPEIAPDLEKHEVVLIAAHGNSLRALAMHLENLSKKQVTALEIPTGVPRVYELTGNLELTKMYELGDPAAIAKARTKSAKQTQLPK